MYALFGCSVLHHDKPLLQIRIYPQQEGSVSAGRGWDGAGGYKEEAGGHTKVVRCWGARLEVQGGAGRGRGTRQGQGGCRTGIGCANWEQGRDAAAGGG